MSTSADQKRLIAQFISTTNSQTNSAQKYLKNYGWHLETAVDEYFSEKSRKGGSSAGVVSSRAIDKVFQKYKSPDEDIIGLEGTEQYFNDLGVDLEDTIALAISCVLGSPTIGEFPRQPFIDGWRTLGCDTLEKMKKKIERLRLDFEENDAFFKKVYQFVFLFIRSEGKRALEQDVAIEYWSMLLSKRFALLDDWLAFLEKRNELDNQKRPVQKDTWNMLLEFSNYVDTDPQLDKYDDEAAFPSIIDDFVAFYRKKQEEMRMDVD